MPLLRPLAAELTGTALLVVGGVGTAVIAGKSVGDLGVALAFGFVLVALAYALGPVSGAHLNPAVTLGMLVAGRIPGRHAAGYVVAQLVGAVLGAALVAAIATGRPGYSIAADGLGANGYGAGSSGGYGLPAVLLTEVLLTFVLVFVILSVTHGIADTAFAGIPIGLTLAVIHLVAIPVDGTSVNPARSLGPALFAGPTALGQLWVFLLAPLVGGLVAAGVHRVLFPAEPTAVEAER